MSRRYYESVGRMHASTGNRQWPSHYKQLPDWIRESIAAGYTAQLPHPGVEQWAKELPAESMRRKSWSQQ